MDPSAPFHLSCSTRKPRKNVQVGVGVIVVNSLNFVYAGIRRNSHGAGQLALPGGYLDFYETWEECAKREVKEEMGIDIHSVEFGYVTNDIMRIDEKHFVTIFMLARCDDQPSNMEPNKCDGWRAFKWEDLLRHVEVADYLFGPLRQLLIDEPKKVLEFLQIKS